MLDSLLLLKGWSLGSYLQIHNYLRDAAENGDEIKNIPSIPKVVLRQKKTFQVIGQILLMASVFGRSLLVCYSHHQSKRQDLQDTLHGEEDGEGRVEVFQDHVVGCRRRVVLKEKGTLSVTAARPRCCFSERESFTFIMSTTVLRAIITSTVYSNEGDATKCHSLYWKVCLFCGM